MVVFNFLLFVKSNNFENDGGLINYFLGIIWFIIFILEATKNC